MDRCLFSDLAMLAEGASLLAAGYHQPQQPGPAGITGLAGIWGREGHSYKLSSIRTTVKGD